MARMLGESMEDYEKRKAMEEPTLVPVPPTALMRHDFMVTATTHISLKKLSQIVSFKADTKVSHSAVVRALVDIAAHDPTSMDLIVSYVLHEKIKPGRK